MNNRFKSKYLVVIVPLLLVATTLLNTTIPNLKLNANTESGNIYEDVEYYSMSGTYMEIQPYSTRKNNPDKTYGIPTGTNKIGYAGKNQSESLSTLDNKDNWGNHGYILGNKHKIPTHTPDGLEITGIEWIKPIEEAVGGNSYGQIEAYHRTFVRNNYKNNPQEVNFSSNPVVIMQSNSKNLPLQWDSHQSMKDSLAYASPSYNIKYDYNEKTRDLLIEYYNVSAKPPLKTTGNIRRLYWNMATEVNKGLFYDAIEIRAHYKHAHNIDIPYNATPEFLRSLPKCKTDIRTQDGWREYVCTSEGGDKHSNKDQYFNPARENYNDILDENVNNMSEDLKDYYKSMAGGTARSGSFDYNSWYTYWTSSYVVPTKGSKTKEQTFADMFNGKFSPSNEYLRLYTPHLIKYKVKVPPVNLKLPYNEVDGVKPNEAKYNPNRNTLDIRTVGLLDSHPKQNNKAEKPIVPAQVKLEIRNRTYPGKGINEFNGFFPYRDLELNNPLVWIQRPEYIPVGTGMKPGSAGGITRFPLELTNKEQELYIRMEINPENVPEEENRKDNVWEAKVKIPSNNVDLLASSIRQESRKLSNDKSSVRTDVKFTTKAFNTKENQEFLSKYPKSPVLVEYMITAPGYNESKEFKYIHPLDQEIYSKKLPIVLPNNKNIPGYKIKLKLTINPTKEFPPNEKTYDNNTITKEIFIPTVQENIPPPKPDIPDPDLILPLYNLEKYQCYLPHNPKTGQRANILYDIGTFDHWHNINWIDASGGRTVTDEEVKFLNTGQDIAYKTKIVVPRGHENYSQCFDYVYANQKATGYSWWDVDLFQSSRGSARVYKHSGVIYKYSIGSDRHVIGYDGEGNPIYCYDYWVTGITDIKMQNSIQTKPTEMNTIDHATKKKLTKSGYGIYSTFRQSYQTDLTKPSSCCGWDTEAYMFMPHLNKDRNKDPKRIVPMDKRGSNANKIFPTDFQTAPNKKSLTGARKQFVDVDYPDGDYRVNFRYKLRAPNFKPTKYPTASQQALKAKYPNSVPALGNCDMDRITVKGNMWDDAWAKPAKR